MFTVLSLSFTI